MQCVVIYPPPPPKSELDVIPDYIVYGPFPNENAACDWAYETLPDNSWYWLPLVPPTDI